MSRNGYSKNIGALFKKVVAVQLGVDKRSNIWEKEEIFELQTRKQTAVDPEVVIGAVCIRSDRERKTRYHHVFAVSTTQAGDS